MRGTAGLGDLTAGGRERVRLVGLLTLWASGTVLVSLQTMKESLMSGVWHQ